MSASSDGPPRDRRPSQRPPAPRPSQRPPQQGAKVEGSPRPAPPRRPSKRPPPPPSPEPSAARGPQRPPQPPRQSQRPPAPRPSQRPPPPPKAPEPFRLPLAVEAVEGDGFGGPDIADADWAPQGHLTAVAVARVAGYARPIDVDAGTVTLRRGDAVVLESERGPALGVVSVAPRRMWVTGRPLPRVVRRALESDLRAESRARLREAEAARVAAEVVQRMKIPAKVVRAECALDGRRLTVHLASEERVELRDLGRQLGQGLGARVEIRHVGVRDAARSIGGVGPCGLQLCCNTFLSDFAPVSIRHAKDQGLALKPERVSGVCGRLMCCLVYEDALYRQQRSLFPKPGKRVLTPKGEGRVREVDVLARVVRVALVDGGVEAFSVDDLRSAAATQGDDPAAGGGPTV